MEALGRSSSMRVGYRVMLDDAMRRGLNFVFAGAVIGTPASLATKRQTVPPATGSGRQSGGQRPGLGTEVPAVGWDWPGTGDWSADRRLGLGLA